MQLFALTLSLFTRQLLAANKLALVRIQPVGPHLPINAVSRNGVGENDSVSSSLLRREEIVSSVSTGSEQEVAGDVSPPLPMIRLQGRSKTEAAQVRAERKLHVIEDLGRRNDQSLLMIVVVVLLLAIVTGLVVKLAEVHAERLNLRSVHAQHVENELHNGLSTSQELRHPMALISAKNFLELSFDGLLGLHEGLRNEGKLILLDTCRHVRAFQEIGAMILFYSYQWLSWERLGPDLMQHNCMKEAIENTCNALSVRTDNIYIWLDILCIPQWHPSLKRLAIDSLCSYASLANLMVIVAPDSVHQHTRATADAESYKDRTWCRVEQIAHACRRGVDRMFLKTGHNFCRIDRTWIETICCFFDGQMTCCRLLHRSQSYCDRETLVPTLLGFYFDMCLLDKTNRLDNNTRAIWKLLQEKKDQAFPKTFEFKAATGEGTRDLFSDFIQRIDVIVNKDPEATKARITLDNDTQRSRVSDYDNRYNFKVSFEAPAERAVKTYIETAQGGAEESETEIDW